MKLLGLVLAAGIAMGAVQDTRKRQMEDRVWLEGKVVCIGCTLAAEYGADAQCTLHSGHAQGLLDKEGRIWTLLDNTRGHGVITNKRLSDKDARLFGWTYEKHLYVELWRYELKKDGKWIGYDYCKTCGFEEGDNKDSDLCPDCMDE